MNFTNQGSDNFSVGVGLSVAPPSQHSGRYMGDQTFHTPNFGDEEFDIPPISLPNDGSHSQTNMPYNTMMGHGGERQQQQQQHHYAQMYLPEHMTTHSGVTYGGSPPPTYTTLSSPHSQQPMGNAHMIHHQHQGPPRTLGRSPNNPSPPRNPEHTNTSEDSDDSVPHTQAQMSGTVKRPSPEPVAAVAKKPKPQKKKKKRDPNEPQKPVSAYALFFRDTQAAIKGQNPNASFGEVSKIVASMWDALEADHKNVYKKKTEAAKKEYLKALAAYRASLVSKGAPTDSPDGSGMYPPGFNSTIHSQQQQQQQQQQHSPPHQQQQHYAPSKQQQSSHAPVQAQMYQQQMTSAATNQYSRQQHQGQGYLPQMADGGMGGMHPSQHQQGMSHETQVLGRPGQSCIRNGCGNGSITSNEWDDEYCSSDCVVTHCRDVFTNWVSTNQGGNTAYHTGSVNKFSGPGSGSVGPDGLSYAT